MNSKQIEEQVYQLLSLSFDINNCFKRLAQIEIKNGNSFEETLKELRKLLRKEREIYQKTKRSNLNRILDYSINNVVNFDSIESIDDKFFNLPKLSPSFIDNYITRFGLLLRDNYMIRNRITRFDYSPDNFSYDESEIADNQRLNTIVVEQQLFRDLLKLFIRGLNEYIKIMDSKEIRAKLIIYKYVAIGVFGKNDLSLIDKKEDEAGTYVYSRLLYDVLSNTESGVLYNYEIIRNDYLSRNLYRFFDNGDYEDTMFDKILDTIYISGISALYQEDRQQAQRIFEDTCGRIHDKTYLETAFKSNRGVKVLTLRP